VARSGRKLNKQKGVDDFIACAEYLIARGYTRPGCLAGEGRSAGGILSGNALVQRPDLWAAVILEVPVANALRYLGGIIGIMPTGAGK
jgi:prolyl oligopeptidase